MTAVLLMGIGSALNAESFEENAIVCNKGDAKACYDAGKIYSAEAYKEKDYDSAVAASKVASFYRKSCDLGYAIGCTAYGMSYAADKNRNAEKDVKYYFQKGCDGGDPTGCSLLKLAHQGSKRYILTTNGNYLFYNDPVAIKVKEYIFIGFVDREGVVWVNKYVRSLETLYSLKLVTSYKVHDYSKVIDPKKGHSDDHAAPSIIYNKKNNEIILVTSYHGSDLYLYKYSFIQNKFKLHKTIKGKYTYPRLLTWHDNTYILLRKQPLNGYGGDLVLRNSIDNYTSETIIVPSGDKTIIYGSRPAVSGNSLFVTYSTYYYSTKKLKGWKIVEFDLGAMKSVKTFDLSSYLELNYYSNRPTAITIKDDTIIVGTAMTLTPENSASRHEKDRVYIRKNRVLILTIDLISSKLIKINHENLVLSPYYHTSIALNHNGEYFYFGKNKIFSSLNIDGSCFQGNLNMFPVFFGRDVLYVSINIDNYYSMTNFKNRISLCINPYSFF